MANVINLNRFRKRAEREATAKQADANRTKFGRTKAERALEATRAEKARRLLEAHKIDAGDAP